MAYRWRSILNRRLTAGEMEESLESIARSSPVILTISGGIITIPSVNPFPAPGVYQIVPASGTTATLTQINGAMGKEEEITLRLSTVGHVVTVTRTPPNLRMSVPSFVMDSIYDSISFRSSAVNVWYETGHWNVPAN
jgi:hypothetical protein